MGIYSKQGFCHHEQQLVSNSTHGRNTWINILRFLSCKKLHIFKSTFHNTTLCSNILHSCHVQYPLTKYAHNSNKPILLHLWKKQGWSARCSLLLWTLWMTLAHKLKHSWDILICVGETTTTIWSVRRVTRENNLCEELIEHTVDCSYGHTWSECSVDPVVYCMMNIEWCATYKSALDLTPPQPASILTWFPDSMNWWVIGPIEPIC